MTSFSISNVAGGTLAGHVPGLEICGILVALVGMTCLQSSLGLLVALVCILP